MLKGRGVPSVSLVFPAWNEEANIERAVVHAEDVLARFAPDHEIIVADSGSTDRTCAIVEALAARVPAVRLVHAPDAVRKLGRTLRAGFGAATKEIVAYSDADLPVDLHELERAVRVLELLAADMVCAYRHDRTSEGPRRVALSWAYNALVRVAFGIRLRDVNFGFKILRRTVLERVRLSSEGSFIDAELVTKASRCGFHIVQVGVDYFPRLHGTSTLASGRVIAQLLLEMAARFPETRRPRS